MDTNLYFRDVADEDDDDDVSASVIVSASQLTGFVPASSTTMFMKFEQGILGRANGNIKLTYTEGKSREVIEAIVAAINGKQNQKSYVTIADKATVGYNGEPQKPFFISEHITDVAITSAQA